MPKGPPGEQLPAAEIGVAMMIGKFATSDLQDTQSDPRSEFEFTIFGQFATSLNQNFDKGVMN